MEPKDGLKKQGILVYSDEALSHLLLQNILSSFGLESHFADSLNAFWELRLNNEATISLLDLTLWEDLAIPETNKNSSLNPLWVILDTGTLTEAPPPELLAKLQGADDFLIKPLSEPIFKCARIFWENQLPIFDEATFVKMIPPSSDNFPAKILQSFVGSLESATQATLSHLKSRDLDAATKTSHAIKSSTLIVGALNLHNLCQWIEIKNRLHSPISERFIELCEGKFNKSLQFYKDLLKKDLYQLNQ